METIERFVGRALSLDDDVRRAARGVLHRVRRRRWELWRVENTSRRRAESGLHGGFYIRPKAMGDPAFPAPEEASGVRRE